MSHSFGRLAQLYETNKHNLIDDVPSHLKYVPNPLLNGDTTGRAVFKDTGNGKLITYNASGLPIDYEPHKRGGKNTRRKANKKRKHFNNSRRRIRRR